jgi:transcriptional regulator with XRE-family HTH domain
MKYARFSKAIKYGLKKKGLSLRALSRDTGIEVSFLSKILRGQRNPPPNSYIIKIANVLNLNPDQLIFDAGRIPKRAIILIKGMLDVMKPLISAIEGKEEEFLLQALDYFLSIEKGKKWFLIDYEKHKNIDKKLITHDIDQSFAMRALDYFYETEEGKRWFEYEFKRLKIPEPDLRPLYKSINKRPARS